MGAWNTDVLVLSEWGETNAWGWQGLSMLGQPNVLSKYYKPLIRIWRVHGQDTSST